MVACKGTPRGLPDSVGGREGGKPHHPPEKHRYPKKFRVSNLKKVVVSLKANCHTRKEKGRRTTSGEAA